MDHKPQKRKDSMVGIGLSLGAGLGAAIGSMFDEIATGVAFGTAAGLLFGALLDSLSQRTKAASGEPTEGEPPRTPTSGRRGTFSPLLGFSVAMLVFAALLFLSVVLARQVQSQALKVLIVLLPVVPALVGLQSINRAMDGFDELQRRMMLESLTFSLTGTAVIALIVGLLENAGLRPPNWTWVIPVICLLWLAGQWTANRRYR